MKRGSTLRLFRKLQFRIVFPVALFVLILGVGLYFFALGPVRDFVVADIEKDMRWNGQAIYNICDRSLQDLLQRGEVGDAVSVRIEMARTLGEIENFTRQNDLRLLVFTSDPLVEVMSLGLPADPLGVTARYPENGALVGSLLLDGGKVYVHHFDFDPWEWRIVLFKDATAYASLQNAITRSYATIGLLGLSSILLVLLINLCVKRPLGNIVASLKKEEAPAYRGVAEFEFLSETIAGMMNSIQEKNEWIHSLISTVGVMILVTDPAGIIVMSNRACEALTGRSPADLLGVPLWDILPSAETGAAIRRYLESPPGQDEEKAGFESAMTAPDGRQLTVLWNNSAIRDEQGRIKWFIGTGIDISQRKNAEQQRRQLEQQLRQAQKMEAVGTLAGGIAHEFNNLLQAISGRVQLLLLKKTPQDLEYKHLTIVNETIGRAADLVRRLLTFSRKMSLHLKPVSINEVIAETVALLRLTFPKSIVIETRLGNELPFILADQPQLEQVIMNLATNARDAMLPQGGSVIFQTRLIHLGDESLSYYLELPPGDYLLLEVSDTGQGMDRMTMKQIYDPFYTTKEVGKGTGLGLSIVYGIITGLDGRLACYSNPRQGTTFKIYLPVMDREQILAAAEHPVAGPLPGGCETILLVDDEQMNLDIAEEMLESCGYQVLRAVSGEEALAVYGRQAGKIDLVILDLGMPGMGGEECLQQLRKLDPAARVLVASGYAAHPLADDPQGFGAVAFVVKPYRLDEMLVKIRNVLNTTTRPEPPS